MSGHALNVSCKLGIGKVICIVFCDYVCSEVVLHKVLECGKLDKSGCDLRITVVEVIYKSSDVNIVGIIVTEESIYRKLCVDILDHSVRVILIGLRILYECIVVIEERGVVVIITCLDAVKGSHEHIKLGDNIKELAGKSYVCKVAKRLPVILTIVVAEESVVRLNNVLAIVPVCNLLVDPGVFTVDIAGLNDELVESNDFVLVGCEVVHIPSFECLEVVVVNVEHVLKHGDKSGEHQITDDRSLDVLDNVVVDGLDLRDLYKLLIHSVKRTIGNIKHLNSSLYVCVCIAGYEDTVGLVVIVVIVGERTLEETNVLKPCGVAVKNCNTRDVEKITVVDKDSVSGGKIRIHSHKLERELTELSTDSRLGLGLPIKACELVRMILDHRNAGVRDLDLVGIGLAVIDYVNALVCRGVILIYNAEVEALNGDTCGGIGELDLSCKSTVVTGENKTSTVKVNALFVAAVRLLGRSLKRNTINRVNVNGEGSLVRLRACGVLSGYGLAVCSSGRIEAADRNGSVVKDYGVGCTVISRNTKTALACVERVANKIVGLVVNNLHSLYHGNGESGRCAIVRKGDCLLSELILVVAGDAYAIGVHCNLM